MKSRASILLTALLLPVLVLRAEELPTDVNRDSPYWQKAMRLMQQDKQGEDLSPEDRAFLDQSKKLRIELRSPKSAPSDKPMRPARDGTEGDNGAGVQSGIPPATLPEGTSEPIQITLPVSGDETLRAYYRKPPGDGPFPALVFIHGGLGDMKDPIMRRDLTTGPVLTRFLAAGYVTVMSTFRRYDDDIQSRKPILDSLAAVEATAALPFVDPKRVAVYGGSGGGSIALELASIAPVQAVIAGEPATVIYTGMLTTGDREPRIEMMKEPVTYLTADLKKKTLEKLKTIQVPILILHGDQHDLIQLNRELFLPMMKEAKVEVQFNLYPGYPHGFYFGNHADLKVVESVVRDARVFLEK